MPVVAIAVAVGGLAFGGATAIGAVIAGTATLAETLTAVAAVGAVTSAVGAVTGNKTLSTVGLVLGGIGGVGALAANAGLLGADATTASIFGSSSDAAASATDAAAAAEGAGSSALPGTFDATDAVAGSALTGGAGNDIVNSIATGTGSSPATTAAAAGQATAATAPAVTGTTAADQVSTDTTQAMEARGSEQGLLNTPTAATAAPSTSALPPTQVSVPQGAGTVPTAPGATTPAAPAAAAPSTPAAPATPSSGGGMSDDMKALIANSNHQMMMMGAVQVGGSLLSGLTNPLTPAQVAALQQQAAVNQATAAQSNVQLTNMKEPLPTATGSSVKTGNGLINTSPATVTGMAA